MIKSEQKAFSSLKLRNIKNGKGELPIFKYNFQQHKFVMELADLISAKDEYTYQHSIRVRDYSLGIAKHLKLDNKKLLSLELGSFLHDVGKLRLPLAILNKTDRLSADEYSIIKMHPLVGYEILRGSILEADCKRVILEHHERVDGRGYPYGLRAGEISILSKIVSAADAYDAMTSSRIYRKAPLTKIMAMEEMSRNIGKQFDADIVNALVVFVNTKDNYERA